MTYFNDFIISYCSGMSALFLVDLQLYQCITNTTNTCLCFEHMFKTIYTIYAMYAIQQYV